VTGSVIAAINASGREISMMLAYDGLCLQLAEADISPKGVDSRFDPQRSLGS
jgi:hypothetical protein